MRLSTDALKQARVVAQHGHAPAASDTAVAIGLLAAGLLGAQKNVVANLTSVGDAAYKGAVATEVQQLVRDAGEMAEAARIALRHA
jgi:formiminotetrahydrofolate cyclodeaminase